MLHFLNEKKLFWHKYIIVLIQYFLKYTAHGIFQGEKYE